MYLGNEASVGSLGTYIYPQSTFISATIDAFTLTSIASIITSDKSIFSLGTFLDVNTNFDASTYTDTVFIEFNQDDFIIRKSFVHTTFTDYNMPSFQTTVKYEHNNTIQTGTLASGITAQRKALVQQSAFQSVFAISGDVLAVGNTEISTMLTKQSSANYVLDWMKDVYSAVRLQTVVLDCVGVITGDKLGKVYKYHNKHYRIIGLQYNTNNHYTTMVLLGER